MQEVAGSSPVIRSILAAILLSALLYDLVVKFLKQFVTRLVVIRATLILHQQHRWFVNYP